MASDFAQLVGTPISIVLALVSIGLSLLSNPKPDFAGSIQWPSHMWALLAGFFLSIALALQLRRRSRIRQRRRRHSHAQREITGHMSVGTFAERKRLEIDKVFVPPRLRLDDTRNHRQASDDDYSPKQALRHAVSEKQDGVIFTGMAGSGKSVLAQWLVHTLAVLKAPDEWAFLMRSLPQDQRTGPLAELLERWKRLLVRLQLQPEDWEQRYPFAFYAELQEGISVSDYQPGAEWLIDVFSGGNDRSDLVRLAQDRLILPVFDGLDQLTQESQHLFWQSLGAFRLKYPGNGPFVLTLRDPGAVYDEPGIANLAISIWNIQALNERQVRRYIQKYYSARDVANQDTSEKLLKAIEITAETTPQIWQWLTEPLLMALITNAFDPMSPRSIPSDRVSLYDEYFEELRWRQRRSPSLKELPPPAKRPNSEQILSEAAFRAMEWAHTELADKKRQFSEYTGVLTWPSTSNRESYRFAHLNFQVYYAAKHLSAQLQHDNTKLAKKTWERSVARALPASRNGSSVNGKESETWQANWRELLTLTTSLLTPSLNGLSGSNSTNWQETPFFQRVMWIAQNYPAPLSTVFSLRLVHAMQERGAAIDTLVDQENIIATLRNILPLLHPSWHRDIWELSNLLNDDGWSKLRELASVRDTSEGMIDLFGALRHRKAAEILLDMVCSQRQLSPGIARAMESMGIAAVQPLAAAYQRASGSSPRDTELHAILIELMGYAGSARELDAILLGSRHSVGIIFDQEASDYVIKAAFDAVARWGSDGTQALLTCLRRAPRWSDSRRNALVDALSKAVLDEDIHELRGYLFNETIQMEMVARVIANKLNRHSVGSASVFVKFMEQERKRFNRASHSLWRDVLKVLAKKILIYRDNYRRRKAYSALYNWLRTLNLSSTTYLRSLLRICAQSDAEVAQWWIEDALQDTLFELRYDALNAFVQRSRRSPDPYSWLNQARYRLPPHVVEELEKRLSLSPRPHQEPASNGGASSAIAVR